MSGGTSAGATRGAPKRTSAAKPAVRATTKASAMPSTSTPPKPRTIGTGDRSSTRKPTLVARPALAMVGPPSAAARGRRLGRGQTRPARLLEAGVELDRVVHRQADQHRQRGHRRHREVAAHERHGAEREPGRAEGEHQRQHPQSRAEHERQHGGHHQHHGDQEHDDRLLHRMRERVRHHRHAAHHVVLAVVHAEGLLLRRALDQRDRPAPLLVAQVRLQPHLDQGRARARLDEREARLRHVHALGRVEHELGDELGVVDRGRAGQPVLERDRQGLRDELLERELAGRARRAGPAWPWGAPWPWRAREPRSGPAGPAAAPAGSGRGCPG